MEDYIINDYTQTKKSLLEENIEEDLKTMESKLITLNKKLKEIRDYSKDIEEQSFSFYAMNSQDIHDLIEDCENLDKEISQLGQSITYYNINKVDLRQKVNEKKNQFLQKLEALRDDLQKYSFSITTKEKKFNDSRYDNERIEYIGNNNNNNSNDFVVDDNKQLKVVQLHSNSEFLSKRKQDLEEIKKTSSQVKSLSEQFKTDVYHQGDMLSSIEDAIINSKENVFKAEDEIKKADQHSRKSRKKIYWLIAIIAFVVISAAILSYMIYSQVSPTPTPVPPTPPRQPDASE